MGCMEGSTTVHVTAPLHVRDNRAAVGKLFRSCQGSATDSQAARWGQEELREEGNARLVT